MIYNQSRHRKETQKWNYQIRYGSVDNCKGRYSYTKFTRCWIAGTFFTLGTLHIVHQYTLSYAQLCNIVILFTDENKEVICTNLVDKEVSHQGSRWNNKQRGPVVNVCSREEKMIKQDEEITCLISIWITTT